ncbi:MAG: autotransporter outer membrane beta-barrel domain-containing protein [Albimonas sp.]|uniref:autotransporter outer membrane beta-barrel domain-containing protein n=1 Tax=Albimonas sp. TaxID=1872425 RepID=UPI00405702E2|tara:strand:+ start:146 stop:1096 length:951 start_codon:yes stop_codon:yes gene_type:complete
MALALLAGLAAGGEAGAAERSGKVGDAVLRLIDADVSDRATGALAMLGVTAVPSETASTLQFDSNAGEGNSFFASQLGGAFTVSDGFPLYLEGYVGYSRYDPVFVFSDGTSRSRLPTKWTTVGAEGGIGWDFALTDTLVFRPIFNVALGHVESDAALLGRIVNRRYGLELQFLEDGRLTAGGFGGSLMLDYEYHSEAYDADLELRYTHLHLEPIAGSKAIDASSTAATLGAWSRLRVPTGVEMFGGPLRAVFEASGSWLPGDQGEVLQTRWLMQAGLGVEFDTEQTWVPLSRVRIVARQTVGANLTGYSLGLSASF